MHEEIEYKPNLAIQTKELHSDLTLHIDLAYINEKNNTDNQRPHDSEIVANKDIVYILTAPEHFTFDYEPEIKIRVSTKSWSERKYEEFSEALSFLQQFSTYIYAQTLESIFGYDSPYPKPFTEEYFRQLHSENNNYENPEYHNKQNKKDFDDPDFEKKYNNDRSLHKVTFFEIGGMTPVNLEDAYANVQGMALTPWAELQDSTAPSWSGGFHGGAFTGNSNTQVLMEKDEVLRNMNLADVSYVDGKLKDIQNELNNRGIGSVKVLRAFSEGGMQANIVETTDNNGEKVLAYNIAGTANPREEGRKEFMKDAGNVAKIALTGNTLNERREWHIKNIEQFNRETGNTKSFVFNGHSAGGTEGADVNRVRPDLVQSLNTFNSPGMKSIGDSIKDPVARKAFYDKITIRNSNIELFNSFRSNEDGVKTHHVPSKGHSMQV